MHEIGTAPEFAVADGIISLTTHRESERAIRHLEVRKLRGTGFMTGQHAYRIASDGLHVYPAARRGLPGAPYELQPERISSGIPALDAMLADGYWPGASTLVAGPSGSGKTLMGLHFIFNGARGGRARDHRHPAREPDAARPHLHQLRLVDALRVPLELMYRSPVDLYLEEWFYALLETIDRTGARRVLIDSLQDLRRAAIDEVRFREYLYSLLQRCTNEQISLMMTLETPGLFGTSTISDDGVSHLSDNVILLEFVRDRARLHARSRSSRHAPAAMSLRFASSRSRPKASCSATR